MTAEQTGAAIAASMETPAMAAGIVTSPDAETGFTSMTAARSVAIIRLVWPIWGCRKAMHADDYRVGSDGSLPSGNIVSSWGAKNIINPERSRALHRCRASAAALLDAGGVRIADSEWAVPEAAADEILGRLHLIRMEFDRLRQAFLENLDTYIEEWKAANPDDAGRIEADRISPEEAGRRISAQVRDFRLAPRRDTPEDAAGLDSAVLGDITDGFFRELRTRAADLRRGALRSGRAGQRTLRSIAVMRERISRFTPFTPGLVPVLAVIDGVLSGMPRQGRLPAADFARLSELVATLSDRSRLEDLAEGRTTPEAWLSGCSTAAGMTAAFNGSLLPDTSQMSIQLPNLPVEAQPATETSPDGPLPGGSPAAAAPDAPSPELLAEVSSAGIWLALDGSVPQDRQ